MLEDIGYDSMGFTNGLFDLYGCGACDCPVCSSGGSLCDHENSLELLQDKCTCVCPSQGYEDPGEIQNPNIVASITSPIYFALYASENQIDWSSSTGDGSGMVLVGNVTMSILDGKISVLISTSEIFSIEESNLYIGQDRLPSSNVNPSQYPFHGVKGKKQTTSDHCCGCSWIQLLCLRKRKNL